MSKRLPPTKISPVVLAIQVEAKRQKLTAYGLAKITGLRISTMQCLLAGQVSPSLTTLEATAQALGLVLKMEKQNR